MLHLSLPELGGRSRVVPYVFASLHMGGEKADTSEGALFTARMSLGKVSVSSKMQR